MEGIISHMSIGPESTLFMSEIADKIRERRKNLGLSQEGLAERLHVSRQTISSWENDKSAIKLENAKPLSTELEIPLDEF